MHWTSSLHGSRGNNGTAIARAFKRTVSECCRRNEIAHSDIDTWFNGWLWRQSWFWHGMQGFRSVRYASIYTTAPNSLLLCVSPVVSRDAQHPSDEYDVKAMYEEDCPEPSVCRLNVDRGSCSSCIRFRPVFHRSLSRCSRHYSKC